MSDAIKPSPIISPAQAIAEAKSDTRHRQKFMKGAMTPQEAHRKWGIGKKCSGCGAPGAIRIRVFMPVDEAMKRAPNLAPMTAVMDVRISINQSNWALGKWVMKAEKEGKVTMTLLVAAASRAV